MNRLILTGGGSAGHVTPHLALIPRLQALGYDLHYIGTANGIERAIIEPTGLPYASISAGKLRRYFSWENFVDFFRVLLGCWQAFWLLRRLKPVAVFAKGGFVSVPVIVAAWLNRVPAVTHESDMTPGLANRLTAPFAQKICYTFLETARHLPTAKRVLTGTPVRETLLDGNVGRGRQTCHFTADKPVLLVIGGSLGAQAINLALRQALPELLKRFQICHICGKGNMDSALVNMAGYCQFEYVNAELADFFAMSDAVISRAGANTLFELLALRKPALLIPLSKKASRGDQILNARSFVEQGYSLILEEENLTASALIHDIDALMAVRPQLIAAMSKNAAGHSAQAIVEVIRSITPIGVSSAKINL